MALNITSKKNGDSLVMELKGKLSASEAKQFDDAFGEAAEGIKEALLDFSGVDYISSAGLRSLFLAKKKMMQQSGALKVLYPTPEVMEVFTATRYDNIVTIVQKEEKEEGDAPKFYPLRPVQRMMVDTHFQKAQSTMMNTGALVKLDNSVDLELLAEALNGLLAAYDTFRCRLVLHPETGDICQRFDGEVGKVHVETMSDEAFEARKQEVKQPYDLIDHPLYRVYIMKTSSASYLYIDFYHVIMDGMAIALLFWREVDKRYTQLVKKAAPKILHQPSSYAAYILEEANIPKEELAAGHDYWLQMAGGFDKAKHLPPPDVQGEPDSPEHELEVPFPDMDNKFFKGKNYSENTFFMAAVMLALAKSTGSRETILTWVHNSRMTSAERRLMGLMLDQYPIRWDFGTDMSSEAFLCALEAKVQEGMQYRKSLDIIYEEGMNEGVACFILQKGSMGRRGKMKLGGTEAVIEEMPANEISAAENTLDIELNAHDDGTFSLVLDYDNHRYTEKAMRQFAATMEKMVLGLQDASRMVSSLLAE